MNTNCQSIKQLLIRDLNQLEKEISSYSHENDIWVLGGDINNTAGNLTLHLCGNLQHFIGAVIGKSGYKRKREDEFGKKNTPSAALISEIQTTVEIVNKTMDSLSDTQLEETYPIELFGKPMTFSYFLIHLTGHLTYHLGQINYHRRLLSS